MPGSFFFDSTVPRLRSVWRILIINASIFLGLFLSQILFQPSLKLSTLLTTLVIVPLIWIGGKWLDQRSPLDYGFTNHTYALKECFIGFGFGLFAIGFLCLIGFSADWIDIKNHIFSEQSLDVNRLWQAILFLGSMILVSLYEELWNRGYHMVNMAEGYLEKKKSHKKAWLYAAILSSLFFSLLHGANPNVNLIATFNIFFAGLMLAYPFWKTGRLYLSIGIHAGWNFAQGGFFGLPVSGMAIRGNLMQMQVDGPDLWTGGSFGLEGGLLGTLGIIIVISLCFFIYPWLKDVNSPCLLSED